MGLPILDEIFAGVRWLISEFLDKAPKPIKFLLFMLFLVGLVAMIPFFMHLIGFHCNTSLETIHTSPLKFSTNIRLAFMGADDIINTSSYEPEAITTFGIPVTACKRTICINNGKFYYSSEDECDNETIIFPYALDSASYNWIRCSDCSLGYFNSTYIRGSFGVSETTNLCFGDAYAKNNSDMSWLQRAMCDPTDRCMPPNYYYYEYNTGTYDCNNPTVCGLNNTEIISEVDGYLDNADGELVYTNPDGRAYDNMVMVKCDAELRPNITFFGIPVFDYRIWLMVAVVSTMFMFLNNIKRH